jgi:stage V sporulation protein SpoVS
MLASIRITRGLATAQGYANTALNQSLDHILSLRGFKSSGKRHIVDMSYVDLDAGDNKNGSVISGLGFLNFANAPAYPQK